MEKRKTIVFTNGCFDGLHEGHETLLKEAKKLGDYLVVGVNSDSSVKRIKGESRPYTDESKRVNDLCENKHVDRVILFYEDTPERLIRIVRPDVLVKGGDWKGKEVAGKDFVQGYGGEMVFITRKANFSTTQILGRKS